MQQKIVGVCDKSKTYSSEYSHVVTSDTSPPVRSLSTGERTGYVKSRTWKL